MSPKPLHLEWRHAEGGSTRGAEHGQINAAHVKLAPSWLPINPASSSAKGGWGWGVSPHLPSFDTVPFSLSLGKQRPCTYLQPRRWQAGSLNTAATCKQNPVMEQNPISGTRRMRARSPTGLTWALASPFSPVQEGYKRPALPQTHTGRSVGAGGGSWRQWDRVP